MNATNQRKLKTLTKSLLIAGVISAVAMPATAKKYRDYSERSNSAYDYARVVDVNPVVETYQENNPVENCWDERRPVQNSRYSDRNNNYNGSYNGNSKRHSSATPEIFGAIIGAVVGNQLGKRGGGKARDIATVAGAVLGGSVGHDVKKGNQRKRGYYENDSRGYENSRSGRYETTRYETVQQCEVKDSYSTREEIVGYDVSYKYKGNVFHTQMNQHPGDKIKVKVTVDPV